MILSTTLRALQSKAAPIWRVRCPAFTVKAASITADYPMHDIPIKERVEYFAMREDAESWQRGYDAAAREDAHTSAPTTLDQIDSRTIDALTMTEIQK